MDSTKIARLNDRIEKINKQRLAATGKIEVLTGSVETALENYSKLYGVDCRGKSLKATAQKVRTELESVTSSLEAEYELREKVVAAIERGDIDEANALLGIVVEPEEEVEEEEQETLLDVNAAQESVQVPEQKAFLDWDDLDTIDDEDDEEEMEAEPVPAKVERPTAKAAEPAAKKPSFSFDLDDDDIVIAPAPAKKPSKGVSAGKPASPKGISLDEAVDSLGGSSEDDDDDDFGFGSMLSGTKFTL